MLFYGRGIKSKILAGMVFLVLVILLTTWIFQIGFLKSFYIYERLNSLKGEGGKIVALFSSQKSLEITPEIRGELFSFAASVPGAAAVLDENNNLVEYIFFNEPQTKQNPKTEDIANRKFMEWLQKDEQIMAEIVKQEPFSLRDNKFRRPFTMVGIPIKNNNVFLGTLILESPLAPIEESASILKKQLTIITLFSLIIGVITALLLSRHLTKPILQISQAAEKIAKGDFDTSININSQDEIGTLGKIINNLPKELQKLENFRKDFIANTTHELKTPISLIQAYAELIRDLEGEDKETRDKNLQVIIDEAARLNHIVEDILYLSQIEPDNIKLNSQEFYVMDILNDVIEKLNFLAKKKNINIVLNCADESIKVFGDKEKIYQVLFNIVDNAVAYSLENNRILINVFREGRIEVIDYGPGISPQDLPHIWDRFYKADKSRKRQSDSTGLGLAIVKNILLAHGFKFGVESKLGQGTMFWIETSARR
ncbi:MAG: sensor histidine kinase [Peptococcaceae bacterium]